MSGRLNYAKQRRLTTLRIAARGRPDLDPPASYPTTLKGWRLTDGVDHPVTVTHIDRTSDHTSDRER